MKPVIFVSIDVNILLRKGKSDYHSPLQHQEDGEPWGNREASTGLTFEFRWGHSIIMKYEISRYVYVSRNEDTPRHREANNDQLVNLNQLTSYR